VGERSPDALGLISEGKDSFTLFYTANEKVSGMPTRWERNQTQRQDRWDWLKCQLKKVHAVSAVRQLVR